MSFVSLYIILACIAATIYLVGKYSLKAFNKYATVDFGASRYSPPSKAFVNVGIALHVIVVLAILAIVII